MHSISELYGVDIIINYNIRMSTFSSFRIPEIGDRIPCQICNSRGEESKPFFVVKSEEEIIAQFCDACKGIAQKFMDQDGEEPDSDDDDLVRSNALFN